jgi:hypothetical protein
MKQRAGGDEKLGLQPCTRIRSVVATATTGAADMLVLCKDMRFIIPERESLVNSDLRPI